MSPLTLIARIEPYGEAGYLAYVDSIKGMVESGATPSEAMKELLISLRVKMAYDLGIEFDNLETATVIPEMEYVIQKKDFSEDGIAKKSINLKTLVC